MVSFEKISLIRSEVEAYADLTDHVDILRLAEMINLNSSQKVIDAINNSIKYT